MPEKQKRFMKGFEEAVRLVRTNGRTTRKIAGDLGVGVSTLTRWIAHDRDGMIASLRVLQACRKRPWGRDGSRRR